MRFCLLSVSILCISGFLFAQQPLQCLLKYTVDINNVVTMQCTLPNCAVRLSSLGSSLSTKEVDDNRINNVSWSLATNPDRKYDFLILGLDKMSDYKSTMKKDMRFSFSNIYDYSGNTVISKGKVIIGGYSKNSKYIDGFVLIYAGENGTGAPSKSAEIECTKASDLGEKTVMGLLTKGKCLWYPNTDGKYEIKLSDQQP